MSQLAQSYFSFLSYSHHDQHWGKRLHRLLEHYGIDKDLVGRQTRLGRIPPRLHPIFRDREGLSADPSLRGQIELKLRQSESLIVICSPAAAASEYVKHEIAYFQQLGRSSRILAIIPGTVAGVPVQECIPEPLRRVFGTDGQPTGELAEPLAADARSHADGEQVAMYKLIAGLLGVPLEEIWKRDHQHQRRRFWQMTAAATVVAALAIGAGAFGLIAQREKERSDAAVVAMLGRAQELMNTTAELTRQYGMPVALTERYLREAEANLRSAERIGGASPELLVRRARLGIHFSHIYADLGRKAEQLKVVESAYKLLDGMTREIEQKPTGLNEHALRLWVSLNGSDALDDGRVSVWLRSWRKYSDEIKEALPATMREAHYARGEAFRMNGRRQLALDSFQAGLAVTDVNADKREVPAETYIVNAKLLLGVATMHYLMEQYRVALDRVGEAIKLLSGLQDDIRTPEGKETLADAYIMAADTARIIEIRVHGRSIAPEHLAAALESVKTGIERAQELLDKEPRNVVRTRLLAKGHMVHGDIRKEQKEVATAFDAYTKSFDLRESLLKGDRNNVPVKHELATSYMKLGEMLRNTPDPRDPSGTSNATKSVDSYRKSIALYEQLWAAGHGPARKFGYWAYMGIEAPLRRLGRIPELKATMERKLELALQGSLSDAGNRDDRAKSHNDLAELLVERAGTASAELERAKTEFERTTALARRSPDGGEPTPKLRYYRAQALHGLGMIAIRREQFRAAEEALLEAREIAGRLFSENEADVDRMKLLAEILWRTSQAQDKAGRTSEALTTCKAALEHIRRATRPSFAPPFWRKRLEDIDADCDKLLRAHGH